jgi:pyridoxine 4-dehydrogenase
MTHFTNKSAPPGGEVLLAGRPVARVGYGTMQLAERPGRAPLPADEAIALLRAAVEMGVNHFDTAQFYGAGLANDLIRRALAPYPDGIVLASKVGADHVDAPFPLKPAQQPHELRASVEDNLASLGVDQLAVVNLRRLDIQPGLLATGDQVVDLDDQLAELVALREEGKIGAVGLSNVRLDQLRRALPVGIACVQNAYSLVERSGEPMLDLCAQQGIAWVPFFPLGSAFPGRPKVTDQPAVIEAARALGATPSQVGLAWLRQHAPNVLLISGTSSIDHLRENVAAGELDIPADMIAHLEA